MNIEVITLTKRYPSGVEALKGVSFSLGAGITGLLGPNGAGKSTLIGLLVDLIQPSAGAVQIDRVPLRGRRKEYYRNLGFLPQQFTPYPSLTVEEFLDYLAILKGIDDRRERQRQIDQVLETVHLSEFRRRRCSGLSGGMRQRAGIAQALLGDPRVLILDEPTAGLDPEERLRFRNLLSEMAFERTVLLSSHIISDLSATAERLLVLDRGRLLFDGSPEALRRKACGTIWEVAVPHEQAGALERAGNLIRSRKEGDRMIARLVGRPDGLPDSRPVEPDIEDSYVWIRSQVRA